MEVRSSEDLEREYLKRRSDLKGVLKMHFRVATCIAIVTFTMGLTLPANRGMANAIFSRELTLTATIVSCSCFAASVLTSFWASRQRFVRTSRLGLMAVVAITIALLSVAHTESAGSPGLRITCFTVAFCSVFAMVGSTWLNDRQ